MGLLGKGSKEAGEDQAGRRGEVGRRHSENETFAASKGRFKFRFGDNQQKGGCLTLRRGIEWAFSGRGKRVVTWADQNAGGERPRGRSRPRYRGHLGAVTRKRAMGGEGVRRGGLK